MAPKQVSSGQTYYPALDGLRGLAILLVLFMHLFPFIPLSRFGWIGVDLFFVLSGFLITNILLADRDKPRFVPKFYARRWIRTMPLYLISLIIVIYLLPVLVSNPEPFGYFVKNQAWFWFQLQNLLFLFKPDGNPNLLNHFWSLAVEEQFYLLIPVLFLLVRSPATLANGCIVIMLTVEVARILFWFAHIPGISYGMVYSFTRIDGLCAGTGLSLIRWSANEKMHRRFIILPGIFVMVAATVVLCRYVFRFPLPLTATCIYPAVAIGWVYILRKSLQPVGWLQNILRTRGLVFAGRVSYGWYIVHQPLYRLLLQSRWHSFPFFQSMSGMIVFSLGSLVLSGSLAVISFFCFERPLLQWKKFFR